MTDPSGASTHRGEPRPDMLYSGTGRSLLAMFVMAFVSVGGMLALIAIAGGAPWNSHTSTQLAWVLALEVGDRLGSAVVDGSWGMLGLFATILVAVALTGRGLFSGRLVKDQSIGTLTGLQLGAFDGRVSVHLIGRIGFFSGNYLAISFLLASIHAVHEIAERGIGGRWDVAIIVLPLMLGGVVLSAHIGIFVTAVDARLSELWSVERELSDRCDALAQRTQAAPRLTRYGAARVILGRAASLTLAPGVLILVCWLVVRPSGLVIGYWGAFVLLTFVTAGATVMTPWMVDVLSGWSERVFRAWWISVVVAVHFLWALWVLGVVLVDAPEISIPIMLAGVAYVVPVAFFAIHRWHIRRKEASGGPSLLRTLSPFVAMDRVVLWDRLRQLAAVRRQIEDLEVQVRAASEKRK